MRNTLRLDDRGIINTLLIPLILSIVFLLATAGFALWAFSSRQDYKNNVDDKIRTAVGVAVKETETRKDNEFQEREKQPLATYQGPAASGSIVLKYPKTWSAYVDDTGKGSKPLDGYFHPTKVPGIESETAYALRVELVNESFADVVKTFDAKVKQGKARSQPYSPANVSSVVGLRVEGEIDSRQQGIMILVPLRDKTIKLYTQSDQFYNDFNNNVLPNFTFIP